MKHLLERACDETRHLYAIAAFAGIRWGEIEKLTWEYVKEKGIIVTAQNAKTPSRRVVDITPALESFLSRLRGATGSLTPEMDEGPVCASAGQVADHRGEEGRAISMEEGLAPT